MTKQQATRLAIQLKKNLDNGMSVESARNIAEGMGFNLSEWGSRIRWDAERYTLEVTPKNITYYYRGL